MTVKNRPVCPVCNATFVKNDHLNRHLRKHTLEKPFTCDICQKSFSRRDVLQRHSRLHTSRPDEAQTSGIFENSEDLDLPVAGPSYSTADSYPVTETALHYNQTHVYTRSAPAQEANTPGPSTRQGLIASSLEMLASLASGGPSSSMLQQETTPATQATNEEYSTLNASPWNFSDAHPISLSDPSSHVSPDGPFVAPGQTPYQYQPEEPFDWHLGALPSFFSPGLFDSMSLSLIDPIFTSRPASPPLQPSISNLPLSIGPTDPELGYDIDFGQLALSALLDRFKFEEAAPCWPSDAPFSPNPLDDAFEMPSPEFLSTALQLYFTHFHARHVFIHAATFNPRSHSAICLLTMAANGSRSMGTPGAIEFSNQVYYRVNTILQQSSKAAVDVRQSMDIILCAALALYAVLLSGNSAAMASCPAILYQAADLARQIRLYSFDGPGKFTLPTGGLPIHDKGALQALWVEWARAETCKRLAVCLIFLDTWLWVMLNKKRLPFTNLIDITIDAPAPYSVFSAPDAKTWASEISKQPQERPCQWSQMLGNLCTNGKLDRKLDFFQCSTSLATIWMHFRCRASLSGRKETDPYIIDKGIARALQAFSPYFGSPTQTQPPNSSEAFLWHLTNMWVTTDFAVIERAAGRKGRVAAGEAITYLRESWVNTPAARRTALHAAQIFAAISDDATGITRKGPWGCYHIYGPFYAAFILWLYATLKSWTSLESTSLKPVCCLTQIVDWERVDLAGMEPRAKDPSYTYSQWILEDGPCSLFEEPIISAPGQVISLLTCASSLECGTALSHWTLGLQHANLLRLWLNAALPMGKKNS